MLILKNFLSDKLFNSLNLIISSVNVNELEDIFDMSYEKKSTNDLECIPLRIHQKSSIFYKSLLVKKNILNDFREEIKEKLIEYQSNKIIFQFCIWDKESYLDMHYDKIYKYGGSLYMNDEWDQSWGGIFEYKNKNQTLSVCPQKNLFVFNNIGELHRVTPISFNALEKRKSIQVWMLD